MSVAGVAIVLLPVGLLGLNVYLQDWKVTPFEKFVSLLYVGAILCAALMIYLEYIPEGGCRMVGEKCLTREEVASINANSGAMGGVFSGWSVLLFILSMFLYACSAGALLLQSLMLLVQTMFQAMRNPYAR